MVRSRLDPRIIHVLVRKTKGVVDKDSIRPSLSKIRRYYPSLTPNAAAQIFARKHRFSVARYLDDRDRDSLKTIPIQVVRIPVRTHGTKGRLRTIAQYDTQDRLLARHLEEINRAYGCGCYTATFALCRKVLENLIIHHVLKKKYPLPKRAHRDKYFDIDRGRYLDFARLLANLRKSATDFGPDRQLVERTCQLCDGFKETADDMTHSLYHIASKKEIDEKNFQSILDLVRDLEERLQ